MSQERVSGSRQLSGVLQSKTDIWKRVRIGVDIANTIMATDSFPIITFGYDAGC